MRWPTLLTVPLLFLGVTAAPAHAATPGFVETTISNPVNVAPPVSRPPTKACTVSLAHEVPSNGPTGAPQSFTGTYLPPTACGATWSKVVLDFTASAKGRQYDRTVGISLGGVQIYFGTTQEPDTDGLTWHIDKDVTQYASLLTAPHPISGGIVSYTSSTDVGVYTQTATLTFYATDTSHPAPSTPDVVVPVGAGDVNATTTSTSFNVSGLPRNTMSAQLEIYIKGNGCDEQWFTAVPDAVAARFPGAGLCGGGPYREVTASVDGVRAGVIQFYPYVYSGGITPTLWRPTVAIGTFNLTPEQLDLTPLVGRLVDGEPHTVTLAVPGARDTWNLNANLLLGTDHGSTQTSGATTQNTIAPAASVTESTQDGPAGTVAATTTAHRSSVLRGYVDTSHGRLHTTVTHEVDYANTTTVSHGGNHEVVGQTDTGTATRSTTGAGPRTQRTHTWSYPIDVDSSVDSYTDDNNYSLKGTVTMGRTLTDTTRTAGDTTTDTSSESMTSHGEQARSAGQLTIADGSSTARWTGLLADRPWVHQVDANHGQITQDTINGQPHT